MPPSATPQIAVIIPHYNDVMRLRRCLNALAPQVSDDVEVVVADNASTDDLTEIRAAFPDVHFINQPLKGAGPARNMGVSETTAPWLMFIDADCVPRDDWIAVGRRIAKADRVIGGPVDVFHETPPPMSGAEAFEQVFAFKMKAYLERDAFLGAGNLITSRSVFETTGGFQQAVSEDKDWSQRAAKAGFVLDFHDDLVASHPSRQDWPALRHKWKRLTSEAYLLDAQGPVGRIKWLAKAILMPASILAHLPRVFKAPALTLQEKWRAAGTLARLRLSRMVWMMGQAIKGRA